MWGKDYQVLVTTHLNTDNLHNHFVVNSVSFRDGHKYRNSIEQHHDLREISDAICKEHGLSVLTDTPFYGGQSRQAYWKSQRDGKPTHREQLKADIEYCLQYSSNWDQFIQQLNTKGYYFDPVRVSVRADGWQRAVRLDRIGYPDEYLDERLDKNAADPDFKYRYNNHRPGLSKSGVLLQVVMEMEHTRIARIPLSQVYEERSRPQHQAKSDTRSPMEKVMDELVYEANHTRDTAVLLTDAILAILLALIELINHYTKEVILTAELRHEFQNVAQFHADYRFLKDSGLHSVADLGKEIQRTESQIAALDQQRHKLRNRIRHKTDPQVLAENRQDRAEITRQIQPLRQRVKRLQRIQRDTPRLLNLLKTELRAEYALKHPIKEQKKERPYQYDMER